MFNTTLGPRRTSLDDFINIIQDSLNDNLAYIQQDLSDFKPQLDLQGVDSTLIPRSASFDGPTNPPNSPTTTSLILFQHYPELDDEMSSSESEVEEAILPNPDGKCQVRVASYTNDVGNNSPYITNDYALNAQHISSILPTPKTFKEEETQLSRVPTPILPPFHDPDADADGETDDGNSDDEYVPSTSGIRNQKRSIKRRTRAPSPKLSSPSPRRYSPYTTPSRSPMKRQRAPPPSRNVQVSKVVKIVDGQFTCPHCKWEQKNRRTPDFLRHVATHMRPDKDDHNIGWWCKGVELDKADEYDVDPDATPYIFRDQLRIGGCLNTFSRRDALKRHLDNKNVRCVGQPAAASED